MGWSPLEMAARSIVEVSLSWYFLFAAWAAFYVAMSYARQLRAADCTPPISPARRRRRSSGRCATRSTRTSCSTR